MGWLAFAFITLLTEQSKFRELLRLRMTYDFGQDIGLDIQLCDHKNASYRFVPMFGNGIKNNPVSDMYVSHDV